MAASYGGGHWSAYEEHGSIAWVRYQRGLDWMTPTVTEEIRRFDGVRSSRLVVVLTADCVVVTERNYNEMASWSRTPIEYNSCFDAGQLTRANTQ